MEPDRIPKVFIRHAADVLGDTATGLSGTEIIKLTSKYAVQYGVDLPYTQITLKTPSKRHALFHNLWAFSPGQQFTIIKEICDNAYFGSRGESERAELRATLISKYRHLDPSPLSSELSQPLIEETKHWLQGFPGALKLYDEALEKYAHGSFERNLLDDLRLSLETLLHELLVNGKSLENQKSELGNFIKRSGGSVQISNMFMAVFNCYSDYQNSYVKHKDAAKKQEIELILEITSSLMKYLVRLKS